MKTYLTAQDICDEHHYSMRTARTLIDEIREQIKKGRYSELAVPSGCNVLVNKYVLYDYLTYRQALKDPTASKYVAPFNIKAVQEICGEGGER